MSLHTKNSSKVLFSDSYLTLKNNLPIKLFFLKTGGICPAEGSDILIFLIFIAIYKILFIILKNRHCIKDREGIGFSYET